MCCYLGEGGCEPAGLDAALHEPKRQFSGAGPAPQLDHLTNQAPAAASTVPALPPFLCIISRAAHARTLLSRELASVSYGWALIRVRVPKLNNKEQENHTRIPKGGAPVLLRIVLGVEAEELDLEDKRSVGRDFRRKSFMPVRQLRWDHHPHLF